MPKYNKTNKDDKAACLSDRSSAGKKRGWREYKLKSLAVAKAYVFFVDLLKYGKKIAECGSWLRFFTCSASKHYKRLVNASFCRCRLCVTCQWRKSLLIRKQLLELVHAHKAKFSSDTPLLLTLTIPNVTEDSLADALDLMAKSWKTLTKRKQFSDAVRSWFRALEVTYNEQRKDYHPHFHILLMVPKVYFERSKNLYITLEDWLCLWRDATGISEITQVDIRKIKKRKTGSLERLIAEVGKYATKPSSYIKKAGGTFEVEPEVVRGLHHALRNRKLVGYGGLFNQLRKELKHQDIEEADLIKISDDGVQECLCPVCKSTLIEEMYRWNIGFRNYVLVKDEGS